MDKVVVTDDYYAVLEVSPFASVDSIRESYKRLALKFHPDKNREETATSDFQLLARAWETLKDRANRAEYDRNYASIPIRTRQNGSPGAFSEDASSRRGREEAGVEEAKFRYAGDRGYVSPLSANEARRDAAKAWQANAREDYLSRLRIWTDFRNQQLPRILEVRLILRREETYLNAQNAESEEEVTQKFHEAIALSRAAGENIDRDATLSQLLYARRLWMQRLAGTIVEYRQKLEQLLLELENDKRQYEEEEGRARALRIQRALEIIGPRDLKAPLFSLIDRKGQAINCWKALSRIAPATKFSASLGLIDEGPWHQSGDWPRASGEQTCGRCGNRAFHVIPECSPSQCPGCGMIACISCHRSLRLLQEYELWITSLPGARNDLLFSVVFDTEAESSQVWSGAGSYSPFDTFGI